MLKSLVITLLLLLICSILATYGPPKDSSSNSVKITHVSIPRYAIAGTDVSFACQFKLVGSSHKLYSSSWWRGKDQFFQYKESDPVHKSHFNFKGITVSTEESSKETVVLKNVNESTSGGYKCDIMGEGPAFKTDIGNGTLTIIVPPENITIEHIGYPMRSNYNLTDNIRMRCTVIGMKPEPEIRWQINGKDVNIRRKYVTVRLFPDDRNPHSMSIMSTIKFQAKHFFERHVATVACIASVHDKTYSSPNAKIRLDPRAAPHLFSGSGRTYLTYQDAGILLSLHLALQFALIKTFGMRHF